MLLSAKLINQFRCELFREKRVFERDVYNIKTIHNGIGSSILFSCRFKHGKNTFIFSVCIQLSYPGSHVRSSIHLLCPRRVFFQEMFRTYADLPKGWSLQYIMRQEKYMNYYKNNRHLPYGVMWNIFHKFSAKELIQFLNVLDIKGKDHD